MTLRSLYVLLLFALGLSACKVHTPKTASEPLNYTITFAPDPNQTYGFDASKYDQKNKETLNETDYWVAWKSIASGSTDQVIATTDKEEFPAYIGFKTPIAPLSAQQGDKENTKRVSVLGTTHGATQQLKAYAIQKKESSEGDEDDKEVEEKEVTLGLLNVVSYNLVRNKVIVVPVNGVKAPSAPELSLQLNAIYGQAVAAWEVEIDVPFTTDQDLVASLDEGESGIAASFPANMRKFNRKFKRSRDLDKNAYYVFLVDGVQTSLSGFMPFKRQYGYIFNNDDVKTIAHELGHGAFRLRHTFSPEAFIANQGSTDNLMDYSGSEATKLYKHQWDNVHNPEKMIGWFQDDEESAQGPPSLPGAFNQMVAQLVCAFKNNSSTEVLKWPTTYSEFYAGVITLFDGNQYNGTKYRNSYRGINVSKVGGFSSGTFSKFPEIRESEYTIDFVFTSDQGGGFTFELEKGSAEVGKFEKLLKGENFDNHFNAWLAQFNAASSDSEKESLISKVPICGLELLTNLDTKVAIIKMVMNNITYFNQNGEELVIKLIKGVSIDQISNFHNKLRGTPYKEASLLAHILYEIDDTEFIFSDGNHATLMEVFTAQCLNAKWNDKSIPDLSENETLFIWAGNLAKGSGQAKLYSSSLLTSGKIKITVGTWVAHDLFSNTETSFILDPLDDWLVIYPKESILHIGYKANTPYVVPAILLHYLIKEEDNSTTRKAVFTGIDVASFAVGVGAISSGIRGWKLAVAVIETVSAGASISLDVFENDLKKAGWDDAYINDLRIATMVMELAGVGVLEGPKIIAKLRDSGPRMWKKLGELGEYSSNLKPAAKQQLESLQEFLRKYLDDVAKGGTRFVAKTGAELQNHLDALTDLPVGKTYSGNMYRSLTIRSQTEFGAVADQMTDHHAYSSWGRYDLDKQENAMYLSETISGNKTEVSHYISDWKQWNTYEFQGVTASNLLDLADDAVRKQLGTQFEDLVRTVDAPDPDDAKIINYEMTNVIASWARTKGYNGIIAPGARGAKDYDNIILFSQSYIHNMLEGKAVEKLVK